MSSAIKILPHYTYEQYCLWEGRWEIIEGIPYAMSPAPAPRHQWISSNVKYELKDAIKKSGCKNCKVYDFIDLKISEDTVLQPDAVVVSGEIIRLQSASRKKNLTILLLMSIKTKQKFIT